MLLSRSRWLVLLGALLVGAAAGEAVDDDLIEEQIEPFRRSEPSDRWLAIERVASLGDRAVPFLVRHLRDTKNPVELRAALLALERIGTPLAAQAVRNRFHRIERASDEATVAALILGVVGPGELRDKLRESATSRKTSETRLGATLALGRLGDREGLREVLEEARKEALARQRIAAAVAAATSRDRLLLTLVLPLLKDKNDDVRRAAALAVGEIGDPSALPVLLEAARREKSETVQAAFALALGRMDDAESLGVLRRWSRSPDEALRDAAWSALAARPDGTEAVIAALGQWKNPTRLASLALACAESPAGSQVATPLEKLLESQHAEVRSAAGLALAVVGGPAQEDAILVWLDREPRDGRDDALLAVGVMRLDGARELLDGSASKDETELLVAVRRTLDGWRDVRLLRDRLTNRLRGLDARLVDRREALIEELVVAIFQLDRVDRRLPGSDGGGGGGGGDSGDGSDGGGFQKSKIDPRNTSLERDLLEWFQRTPYFPPPPASRSRA